MRSVLVLLLLIAACGGTASDQQNQESQVPVAPSSSVANSPATTAGDDSPPTTSPADSPSTTDSGRPVAPDFTLELAEGGQFTLSEGSKPVYIIFWAEW
ncbi:MAG: peroxiredoxin family protein [Acidimicrobiia bacterium]